VSKPLKSVLKAALYVVDQLSDRVDRVSDRVSDLTDRGRTIIHNREDHTIRNVAVFAAGVGVGVGVGVLFAPAKGQETRDLISEKVQEISDQVGDRLRSEVRTRPTGTEPV
jgi:hypothetical protein